MTWTISNNQNDPQRKDANDVNRWQSETYRGVISSLPLSQIKLHDNARIAIEPRVVLRHEAVIRQVSDVLCIGPLGSRNDFLTVTFYPHLQITTGCFTGSIEQFKSELYRNPSALLTEKTLTYEAAIAFIETLALLRKDK